MSSVEGNRTNLPTNGKQRPASRQRPRQTRRVGWTQGFLLPLLAIFTAWCSEGYLILVTDLEVAPPLRASPDSCRPLHRPNTQSPWRKSLASSRELA